MKKMLLTMIIAFSLLSCTKEPLGSDDNTTKTEDKIQTPPQAVLDAFTAKFGSVKVDEWKLRSDGTWRAHFSNNGTAWEASFSANGALVKSERA